ncbi:MAG: flagellar biosynthesis protein FlhF [Selenomonadaceae bacterium]|nr:flagellar biosynthesis protein FlhF [Selenomonadaceae bacterium]
MQIKVFKAGNMKDAMAAMKAELGDEAVILHSKKYKEGGLLGIGSREVVEITAAVEENSLPKKTELPRPTVAPNSIVTRYKTDGTETAIKNLESEMENEPATKVEEESKPVEENPQPMEESQPVEENPQPVEESKPVEENPLPVEESKPVEENPLPTEESKPVEENPQPAEEFQPVEENPLPVEEFQPVEENPLPAEESQTVEENSQPAEESKPVEENSQPVEKSKPAEESSQQSTVFTEEQMAQTQAMIMAQFNQMQMMQQAAIAQAQAQAVEQIRLQQAQSQENIVQPVANPQNEEKIKHLEEEIAQMKALLAEVLGRAPTKGIVTLHEALKSQEVEDELLTEMATQANAGDTLVDVHTPTAKTTLTRYLNEHVKFVDGVKLNRHGVRIVALLGTTGVGKTTTLAKIAAKFVLEQRTNVALITADTYRISAVEQLKTYSDILELPLEIVYNPAELASAIERHRDKDLILIDTAGRSQHNEYQMRELEEFLRINPRIEKHLVISATTKFTDARHIMNKFSQIEPDKVIFTKIDETASLGMIINLLHDRKYSLSYITTGQSVPDDIERASADLLSSLLLKKIDEL